MMIIACCKNHNFDSFYNMSKIVRWLRVKFRRYIYIPDKSIKIWMMLNKLPYANKSYVFIMFQAAA